jgi:hypothetical protein
MEDLGRAFEVVGDFEEDVCWDSVHGHIGAMLALKVDRAGEKGKVGGGQRPYLTHTDAPVGHSSYST